MVRETLVRHQIKTVWPIGIVLVFILGNYVLGLSTEQKLWWTNSFWTAVSLLAAWRCVTVARGLKGSWGKAWFWFGAACASWFIGIVVWAYRELVLGDITPFPAWSDLGFLAMAPLFAAGLLCYRAEKPGATYRLMEYSQFGILLSCIASAHVVLFYELLVSQEHSHAFVLTALAYPVLYMTVMAYGLTSRYFYARGPVRRVLGYLLAGLCVHAFTNSTYAYALLGYSYKVGHYLDVAWIMGFVLIEHAARLQLALECKDVGADETMSSPRELRYGRMMPPLAILATVLFIIGFREELRAEMLDMLIPIALCLLTFLALREWASGKVEERLNETLQLSEAHLRQTAKVAPVGIFRGDAAGNCNYVNAHCMKIMGLQAELAFGKGWLSVIHPDDREKVTQAWLASATVGMDFRDEYRLVRSDGSQVWVLTAAVAERDENGTVRGYVGTVMDITARREMEEALRESEERFRKVFSSSPVIVSICQLHTGKFIDVNAAFCTISGWKREEIIGRTTAELNWVSEQDRARMIERLQREGEVRGADWSIHTKSGETRHVLGSIELMKIDGDDCLVVVAQDITDRMRADAQMHKLSSALEQTADAVMITDRNGMIEYVNFAFEATTGYTSAEVIGKKPSLLNSKKQGREFFDGLWTNILAGKIHSDVIINRRKDGSHYYEEKTITPIKDALGVITHFVSTGRDITERMETQDRLQFLAHHDVLTALPNRSLFIDRLSQSLAYARWHERLVAVLFLDIDRFKIINDTLGHEAGDHLLQQLAGRLSDCLRERDTVARFGGDEFVILLSDVADAGDVKNIAQKILEIFSSPFVIEDASLHVSASIGISLFPADGEEPAVMLRNADNAMYRAKELGRNNYQFYSSDLGARVLERLTLENSLRRALERNEFILHYQPQLNAADRRVIGVEALLRWQHPEFGLVPPLDFVALLEETGLIVPVGEWVLHTACMQLASWQTQGLRDLRMAVNISGRQFENPSFRDNVMGALEASRISPRDLELEITESILMRQDKAISDALEAITALQVRLGMDDFGTGYSSLGYLRRFPINTLKIDRSFIRDLPGDPEDAAITQAIIVMAQSLKLDLVAEGVETQEQVNFLQGLDCHVMQGYLFSRPLPAEAMTRYLRLAADRVS